MNSGIYLKNAILDAREERISSTSPVITGPLLKSNHGKVRLHLNKVSVKSRVESKKFIHQ